MFDDEIDPDHGPVDKTVTLSVMEGLCLLYAPVLTAD